MSEWQPIETAPRNKSFLGFWTKYVTNMRPTGADYGIVRWADDENDWVEPETRDVYQSAPDWWIPLPDPPKG